MFVSQSNSPAPLSERWPAWSGRRRLFLFAGLGAVGALGHPPLGWPVFTIFSLLALFALRPWLLATMQAAWAGWAYGLGYFGITLHWIVEPFFVDLARHGWMAPFALLGLSLGCGLFCAFVCFIGCFFFFLVGCVLVVCVWFFCCVFGVFCFSWVLLF